MTLQAYAIAGATALFMIGAAGWKGYSMGAAAERVAQAEAREKVNHELFALSVRHGQVAADLAALQASTDQSQREFEDAARDDPAAAGRRPDAASLRDLEALWQGARAAP